METQPTSIKLSVPVGGTRAFDVTSPAPREVWSELAAADTDGLVTQTPQWMDALCASGAYRDASRLYSFEDGRQVVLPLARQTGRPGFLASERSMPDSWGMGGTVSAGRLKPDEAAAIFEDLQRHQVLASSIRVNPLLFSEWAAVRPAGVLVKPMTAHVLDLEGGFAHIWSKMFRSETRTAVRKAERSGLVVEVDTTGRLIPEFYLLFEQSVERWAKAQHEPAALARLRAHRRDPMRKFEQMAKAIGNAFHLWMAWKNGEPAAAILVLMGRNASYTRGAMNQGLAGPTRANELLHRLAIEQACLSGCRYYHMGETGNSTPLARFKSQFGALPVAYGEYWIEKLPVKEMDQKLRKAVKTLIGFSDAS